MKVKISWSVLPLQVYAITWGRYNQLDSILGSKTTLSVLENDALSDIFEHECDITSSDVEDFVLMPKSFDPRVITMMWKPLADAGIWEALRNFDISAINHFAELRADHGTFGS